MEKKQKKQSALSKISGGLFSLIQKSFIGRFFTSYDKDNKPFLKTKVKKAKSGAYSKRRRVISRIENNKVINAFNMLFTQLLRVSIRDYGVIFFLLGIGVTGLYPLNGMIMFVHVPFYYFVFGISISTCALPLLFSKRSLASGILSSKIVSFIIFDFLGCDKEDMEEIAKKDSLSKTNVAILIGLVFGFLAYFVSPITVAITIVAIAVVYLTFKTPEVGAILIIFILPFAEKIVLFVGILCTFVSYMIKIFMGKRLIKLEYLDIFAFSAIIFMIAFGMNYSNPLQSLPTLINNVVMFLAYFIYSNIIRSKEWFKKCLFALANSALIVALIAIFQSVMGGLAQNFESLKIAFENNGAVSSTFASPIVLAQFMVVAIPFSFVHMFSERKDAGKFFGFLITAVLITALILSNSKVALIGLFVGVMLLLLVFNRNHIFVIAFLAVLIPILAYALPEDVLNQVFSLIGVEKSSIPELFSTLGQEFLMLIKSPFGFRAGANVNEFFPEYQNAHINSLPLQMLFDYGIIAIIVFAMFLIVFARLIFSYCVKAKNKYRKINCCAGFCALTGLFTMGIFDYVWYDSRIFLLSVVCAALSFAYIKIEREENIEGSRIVDISTGSVDVELNDEAEHDKVSRRMYLHVMKRKPKNTVTEAKEFSNTEDFINIAKEDIENEERY
ncbi:MAG: hypothetical protein IJW54_07700 [Clostridia bacterium]|nr:hypothetical protein [Clostridia bacterium]